jgi:membrane fusion protein, macrolide-specific efflux system
MKMKKWFWIVIFVSAVAGAVWWFLRREKDNEMVAKYGTVKVERGDIEVTVQSTATVLPQNRLEIKPPIAGRADEVLVKEGDQVKAGQIIAWMSSTDRAALLDAARAQDEATVEHWKDIYKATPIVAPLDGLIIVRNIEPGQTVNSTDTLLVMSDVLIVEAQVDETDLAEIRMGQHAVVTLDAYPDQNFEATVSHISYEAETVQNVTIYKVDVMPTNMPGFVRSGMTANVTFTARNAANVLILPVEAVRDEGEQKVVWVSSRQTPGEKETLPVKVGLTDGKNYEIREGLKEGDEVLIPKVQTPISSGAQKTNPFMPFGGGRASRPSR